MPAALPKTEPAALIPGVDTLGLLGGGQLGRMFVHAAQCAGFAVQVLEPEAPCPAGRAADDQLVASYDDEQALAALARQCTAITTEFENVPASSLDRLVQAGCRVWPQAAAVQVCQERGAEKQLFGKASVPCVPYRMLVTERDVVALVAEAETVVVTATAQDRARAAASVSGLFPAILKTARMGYDGKGQRQVASAAQLHAAWRALGAVPCILEQRVPLAAEISVILARSTDGAWVHLPVQQNLHRQGVLALTQVPAPDVSEAIATQAIAYASAVAQALGYVGVLCVEFFVLSDGQLLANEMAPRPHNSGHYSLDACDVSQFDLQLQTLAQWPLASPRQHSAAVMLNLLGDLWFDANGQSRAMPWGEVAALPGAHLHLYAKAQARPGRKMGHLTFTAPTLEQAQIQACIAAHWLGLPTEGLGPAVAVAATLGSI